MQQSPLWDKRLRVAAVPLQSVWQEGQGRRSHLCHSPALAGKCRLLDRLVYEKKIKCKTTKKPHQNPKSHLKNKKSSKTQQKPSNTHSLLALPCKLIYCLCCTPENKLLQLTFFLLDSVFERNHFHFWAQRVKMREITSLLTANLSEERQILAITLPPPSKLPQRLEQTDLSFSVIHGSRYKALFQLL